MRFSENITRSQGITDEQYHPSSCHCCRMLMQGGRSPMIRSSNSSCAIETDVVTMDNNSRI